MNGRQEGKLVTYICPTCGTSLKFDGDKKKTVCPSCKNEVEKQFVVNLNFAGSADDEAFKNFYTYDKSLFKFNFEDRKDVLTNTKRREFVEIPSHRLSANDVIALDCLIQELLFKMDKPNKIKETGELYRYANEILSIDDNNVYGVFLLSFLSGQPLTDVLSRRDSLDKANFFVQYLMTNNKVLSRNFDEDIDQIVSYVLNSNLETAEEKFEVLSSIFFEHLEKKHYFNEYAESVFIIASCDCSLQLRQNFIKRLMDICLLNDYQSFIKYIRVCLSVNLDIDCLFAKNKIKCYIYGLNANSISNVIEFLWSFDSVSLFKKKDYTISILDQFLFSAPINLSAQECAEVIDVLKIKHLSQSNLKNILNKLYF